MKRSSQEGEYVGTVLWFCDKRGYGFIECPRFEGNIFVHFNRVESHEDFKTLSKGQVVTFEATQTTKGFMAVNVRQCKIIPVKVNSVQTIQQ